MSTTSSLTYDMFVNEPPRHSGLLPNGEPKDFSPIASTLICGSEDAVLTDPAFTTTSSAMDAVNAPRLVTLATCANNKRLSSQRVANVTP